MPLYKLLFSILCLCLLGGCWDRTEIEDIGFLLAVGLDPIEDQDQDEETSEERKVEIGKHDRERMFRTTFQVALPKSLQNEDGNGMKSYINITTTGMTNLKISRNTVTRNNKQNNAEHLQTIIINEQLAKKGMIAHLVDLYLRDHEMRRRVHILISRGEAKTLLEQKLQVEEIPAIAIKNINENYTAALQMLKYVEIGELSSKLVRSESYVLPRISSEGGADFKIAGGAVFDGKTNIMLGWLSETDVEGYNWIMGEANNGVLEVEFEKDANFVFEAFTMSSTISYEKRNENNHFTVSISVEGTFGESWLDHIPMSINVLNKLELAVERKIKEQVTAIIQKMQTDYHHDIFGFGQKIKQEENSYWLEIKENWDAEGGEFQKSDFEVLIETKIRNTMTEEQLN
ncbi:Ger(x)C family spore germination protein [Bacillus horti]|uniref:Spore germination protein n=1 Tax=Caldalkalibacillus horti TaxID=77523 RepID=A0ABT9W5C1_9BACI|nr:Ger(x)C family spore germination protein [Bacillus horti]MDQ0168272.1 spore germination protein [Bacillus horti]